jgi:hypothetical protein
VQRAERAELEKRDAHRIVRKNCSAMSRSDLLVAERAFSPRGWCGAENAVLVLVGYVTVVYCCPVDICEMRYCLQCCTQTLNSDINGGAIDCN